MIAMYLKKEKEKKSLPVDPRLETLTSGDSGLIDLQFFYYIEYREKVISEQILAETDPKKILALSKILQHIRAVKSLMLEQGVLLGNCHIIAGLISCAKEISLTPRGEKNLNPRDDFEQLQHDFERIKAWDRTPKGLKSKVRPEKKSADNKQKTIPSKETLEQVFERIFSYAFQQHTDFMDLLELDPDFSFGLEIVGPDRKIFRPNLENTFQTVFFCNSAAQLAKFLQTFPALLPTDQQIFLLRLLPFYKGDLGNVRLNSDGHSVSVSANNSLIHVNDQDINEQFDPSNYVGIAECIFRTRENLYIKKRKAKLFIEIHRCHPFVAADAKEVSGHEKLEQKIPVIKIPSSLELLMYKPINKDQLGVLLWLALINDDNNLLRHVLSQKLNANVTNVIFSFSTLLMKMAESGRIDIVEKLLAKGALTYLENENGDTAFTLAEKFGHTDIMNLLIKHLLADESAAALHRMMLGIVKKIEADEHLTHRDSESIRVFMEGYIQPHSYRYCLKVILTKILLDYLQERSNPKSLRAAIRIANFFRNAHLDYRHFVCQYIIQFPAKDQYHALITLLPAFSHHPEARNAIRFAAFQYGLLHNDLLCNAMFANDHTVLTMTNGQNKTIMNLARSAGNIPILKKLQEMTAIVQAAQQPKPGAAAKSSLSASPKSSAAIYKDAFFAEDVKKAVVALPAAPVAPPPPAKEEVQKDQCAVA